MFFLYLISRALTSLSLALIQSLSVANTKTVFYPHFAPFIPREGHPSPTPLLPFTRYYNRGGSIHLYTHIRAEQTNP